MEKIVLKPGKILFFYTRVGEIQTPSLMKTYREISSKKERSKIDRYIFEKDRHTCLVTRGLVRFVLSQCTKIPPQALGFEKNSHGKPRLKSGITDLPLFFNLSHAGGLTACAVVLAHEIGIDVEDSTRKIDINLANRFFSKQESEVLGQTMEDEKKNLFFDFWTLKESYIKAKGRGLSIPLDKFSFTISREGTAIRFHDGNNDDANDFSFFRFPLLDRFKAAITICAPKILEFNLSIYQCVPFEEIKKQDQIKVI
ncbi:MAG: phosphopantetheinyl transferase [Deltaproteobacteria bacterium]|nr:MAG: phosphopantetheinyl transferase [Deltaproteobacteria bacterium]